MGWLKRDIWKAGFALASMLLLLILMVWVPVSAAGAYEGASGLATPATGTVQATPTEDATVTALNKEKLAQEVQQLKNQNEPDPLILSLKTLIQDQDWESSLRNTVSISSSNTLISINIIAFR